MEVLLGSGRAVHVRAMGRDSLAKEGHTSTSHILPVYIQNMLFLVFVGQSDKAETGFCLQGAFGLLSSI
jgi:hypothetical protein